MRITFVLPPYEQGPVGGYKVVYEYAAGLAGRGHTVTLLHDASAVLVAGHGLTGRARLRHLAWSGRRVLRAAPSRRRPAPAWGPLPDGVQVREWPLAVPALLPAADATVATSWRTAEWVARAPRRAGTLCYFLQHHETWGSGADRVDRTWAGPWRRIVIARWLLELAEQRGLPAVHVPNALDLDKFRLQTPLHRRPARVALLLSHHAWKAPDVALAVLERVRSQLPQLQVVAFGTAARPAGLATWVDYRQDPSGSELVDDVYNGSAVYLCTSRGEGWHLPPAEAMACGCAVVSTDIGGVRDYLTHGETGLLAPVGDVEALADAVVDLLRDDRRRQVLADAGRRRIGEFSFARSLAALEQVLLGSDPAPAAVPVAS